MLLSWGSVKRQQWKAVVRYFIISIIWVIQLKCGDYLGYVLKIKFRIYKAIENINNHESKWHEDDLGLSTKKIFTLGNCQHQGSGSQLFAKQRRLLIVDSRMFCELIITHIKFSWDDFNLMSLLISSLYSFVSLFHVNFNLFWAPVKSTGD